MNGITMITTKGQVIIPTAIRKQLKIYLGDKISFTTVDKNKREIVVKVIHKSTVDELAGSLISSIKETNMDRVRQKVGEALGKKYKVAA